MTYEMWMENLSHSDAELRVEAARGLGNLRDPRALQALIRALGDENGKAQYAAFSALVKLGDPEAAVPMIDVLLSAPDSRLWELLRLNIGLRLRSGLLGLVARGDEATATRLQHALDDINFDETQRAYLLQLLGRTGCASAVEDLINRLVSGPESIRFAAADALGWIGDDRAVTPLLVALSEARAEDPVREVAAEALGRIGNPSAAPVLIAALRDDHEWVRRAAAVALGELGIREAMDALGELLADESVIVQDAAFEAIKQLSDERYNTVL